MPAGMVRPRASQVPALSPAARLAWRDSGWRFTAEGRVDAGTTVGPCARCQAPTCRYGPHGQPLCLDCRPAIEAATEEG